MACGHRRCTVLCPNQLASVCVFDHSSYFAIDATAKSHLHQNYNKHQQHHTPNICNFIQHNHQNLYIHIYANK